MEVPRLLLWVISGPFGQISYTHGQLCKDLYTPKWIPNKPYGEPYGVEALKTLNKAYDPPV